jgi:transcription factor IIIB 90 kDa subunit
LKDLFVEGADEKDDKDLYTLDDKSDGEGMLIIEEEGGGIGLAAGEPPRADGDDDAGGDGDGEGSEKGDDQIGWEDAYEQEV